jgi:aminoglycoside phosphotransferase (APT) family kinase protein
MNDSQVLVNPLAVEEYLKAAYPVRQDIQVINLTSITSGWENEMYAFDLQYGPSDKRHQEGLVLRIYPGVGANGKSLHEFESMRKLEQAGYPVPHVHLLERDNSPFGRPFVIMERIDGQEMLSVLMEASRTKQSELITLFCDLFVRLHRLDWRPFVDDPSQYELSDPYLFIDQWLDRAKNEINRFSKSELLPVVTWLEERRDTVPCPHPSVVHFDFHPNNILLRDDGSPVVIDWPGLNVTDARFDLGWTLLLTYAYLGKGWRDRILREYERLVGGSVEQVGFFEVFACVRRLFDVTVSLSVGAEKLGMRPGAVENMRQQMDALAKVYELLVNLTGIRIEELERMVNHAD